MARARNIKPGFYQNEDLAECSVWARFIFPGLWMLADRDGRLEDRPKRIKAQILPFDNQDIEPLLSELSERKFIYRYESDGSKYIQILGFSRHQSPHYSEKPSIIKPPSLPEYLIIKEVSQPPDSLNPDSLNPDSLIPEGLAGWGLEHGYDATYLQNHWSFFVNYLKCKGKKYKDYDAAFRNCVKSDWGGIRKQWSPGVTQSKTAQGIRLLEDMKG